MTMDMQEIVTIFGNKSSLTHGRSSTTTWEEDKKRSSAHFQANLSLVDENDWIELGLEVICHNLKRTYSMQHNQTCSSSEIVCRKKDNSAARDNLFEQAKQAKPLYTLEEITLLFNTISYNVNQKIRAEPFLTIFSEKWTFLTKIDYARPLTSNI